MNISLLVPTRKRPDNMLRLTESVFDLAAAPANIEIIFYIDKDDETSRSMAYSLKPKYNIKWCWGERIILSQMWNECYKLATANIFQHSGDDVVFRTKNWDTIVLNEFNKVPDKILFLYGRDGIVDSEKLGTHGFLHKNWVDTVGYFVPPYFSWCYNDTWLTEVATLIDRLKYIPELYIEHMHPAVRKALKDSTYIEAVTRGKADKCLDIFESKKNERIENAERLKEFIKNYG